jgi:8-amino-7-oxononanoate synthase
VSPPERRGAGGSPERRGADRTSGSWAGWVGGQLDQVRSEGRWRQLRVLDADGTGGVLADTGQHVTSFAGNDYLGLSRHPDVRAAAVAAIERWGTGAGASRLVVGTRPVHAELEGALAAWRGQPAALVLPTGYAANLSVLSTLAGPGTRICSDELNHASIVDGCRLAAARGAEVRVYRHLDLDHLADQLAGTERALVVTDAVFSMDGDVAPLDHLGELCARHGALLVVDDAHLVLGAPAVPEGVEVVRVGTLSKALGSLGGYVAASQAVVDLLVNRARPFIFTTALSPADAAAGLAAVGVAASAEGDALRARLRVHVDAVRPGHPSPVVPVVLGSEAAAVAASEALLERGLLVPAIRPPTVPAGSSRLRVALSAAHTASQVMALRSALADLADLADRPTPARGTEGG